MLREAGVRSFRAEFLNRGVEGELTGDMRRRFDYDTVSLRPDVAIVLGGSNDLGWGLEPRAVADNLEAMYETALAREIKPVACTVPSVLGFDEGISPRLGLNELIRKAGVERGILCVDLFRATADADSRLRPEYSNDGLHLTVAGYQAMAEAIFSEAVASIMAERLGKSLVDHDAPRD